MPTRPKQSQKQILSPFSRKGVGSRVAILVGLFWPASWVVAAESPKSWFPAEPSCTTPTAPADAGAVVTPGGFMLVHPRNDRIADDYTGCKTLWIYDDPDVPRRWATLRFVRGELVRAVIWHREKQDVADRVCDRPASAQAPECSGVEGNELTALRLPSWPRACATDPDRKECAQDPR